MTTEYTISPVTLADHLAEETLGERTPAQVDLLYRVETLTQRRRFELVVSMTAQVFVKLSPSEKRNYRRWAKHFRDVFSEKYSLFDRHTPADIDLPTYLQAKA